LMKFYVQPKLRNYRFYVGLQVEIMQKKGL
jgi:hypothetical protein